MLEQKYPKSPIEASILKAKEIPLEILRQPKAAKNEEIIPFTFTYNPSNPNVFPIIKQSFDNFHYSKIMVEKCGKNWVGCPYLLRASLCQFKRIKKTFFAEKLL